MKRGIRACIGGDKPLEGAPPAAETALGTAVEQTEPEPVTRGTRERAGGGREKLVQVPRDINKHMVCTPGPVGGCVSCWCANTVVCVSVAPRTVPPAERAGREGSMVRCMPAPEPSCELARHPNSL